MDKKRLLETLEALRAELTRTEQVDPETLAQLEQLTRDIRREVQPGSDAAIRSDAGGLKELLLKFEGDHPQLSNYIGRVADALAAMGI